MVMAPLWRHDLGMALPTNLHALDADALRQLRSIKPIAHHYHNYYPSVAQ